MSGRRTAAALQAWQRAGGQLRVRVVGWSMAPLLHPGDLIEAEPCQASALQSGDLVLVREGAGLLAHRLLRANGSWLWLRGDALPTNDGPLPRAALLGRVLARERNGQRLDLCSTRWALLGRLLVLPGPRIWRLALRGLTALLLGGAMPLPLAALSRLRAFVPSWYSSPSSLVKEPSDERGERPSGPPPGRDRRGGGG